MEQSAIVKWKSPESKSVGLFTDLSLYYDALKLCKNLGVINLKVLRAKISGRLIGLRYIEQLKKRAFTDLIRELNEFGWITQTSQKKTVDAFYEITLDGIGALELYETSKKNFLRKLSSKMQNI
jgi:hypothetical protein